jgi:HEAT repeat protein
MSKGNPQRRQQKDARKEFSTRSILSSLVSSGLFTTHTQDTVRFNHPIILGYLAAWGFCDTPDEVQVLLDQPDWIGKSITLEYLACFQDVTPIVHSLLAQKDVLNSRVFQLARWLRIAPKQLPWRGTVLRSLANLLQKEYLTSSVSARAMTALVLSGDPAVQSLFRQIIKSEHENHRIVGALGLGMLGDGKVLSELVALCEDDIPAITLAACLAMVSIGGKQAMDTIAALLLQGSETVQRAAAQAFANDPDQGYLALQDGTTIDDLMVRRAVVFGLERINQPWVIELLEKVQIEDGQWVVRNAAAQGLENLHQPLPYIPKPQPELSETPWLISFAGTQGVGVTPGKPALELVQKAVLEGSVLEKLYALDYLRLHGGDGSVKCLYDAYFSSEGIVHEAAFNAIWHIASSGVRLPHPKQFGLGEL